MDFCARAVSSLRIPTRPARWNAVARDGAREDLELDGDAAFAFASEAATAFGVGCEPDGRVRQGARQGGPRYARAEAWSAALVVAVRFLEGRYHGADGWPPGPGRLFQALMAGAARGSRVPPGDDGRP